MAQSAPGGSHDASRVERKVNAIQRKRVIKARTDREGKLHGYECWTPRGGTCRVGCTCWCHIKQETVHND